MASETPANTPKTDGILASSATTNGNPKPAVEYDDFGLPIRKARARTPVVDSSDEAEEKSEDAVTTDSADTPGPAPADPRQEEREATEWVKPGPTTKEGYALPELSGRVRERVETIVRHEEEATASPPEPDRARSRSRSVAKHDRKPVEEHVPELPQGKAHPQDVLTSDNKDTVPSAQDETTPAETSRDIVEDTKPAVTSKAPTENGELTTTREEQPQDTKPGVEHAASTEGAELRKSMDTKAPGHKHQQSTASINPYSHQQTLAQPKEEERKDEGEWQTMPAYARYDMYDDDNRLIAKENTAELEDMHGYANVGGAAKGYTRVIMDDDADSVTSMDDNTAYLFKEQTNALHDEDEAARDPLSQMQATKNLLTEGQRVAYVGLVRLAMVSMVQKSEKLERNKNTKKAIDILKETLKMWSQMIMLRLYSHMDISSPEQIMIEQLSEHGVVPADLSPALMQNARVKNPVAAEEPLIPDSDSKDKTSPQVSEEKDEKTVDGKSSSSSSVDGSIMSPPPPPYEEHEEGYEYPQARPVEDLPDSKNLDIDLRWTVMCDLFLVLISDGVYDSRSRELFEQVGKSLSVDWLEICRFEKRVTEALEMQEQADKENWNEDEHMKKRARQRRNRRLALMGLATVGGGLMIGLSAGLLAPMIGGGLAAGFTAIGVSGTGTFLAGTGGAAIVTTTGVVTGSTIGVRAADRRTGNVKTFEYRPLHNNKRTNLIITLAGWMNGKVDDVRLPYSTVDPIMGDIYSVLWEPEMLRSMGDTINILATEALTQGLQQVLGSTFLMGLMSAMMLPLALTKLSYLIDNPWVVSQARADMAGLILADSLMDRNLGTRPVTLVGFSLGARVVFSCLKELSNRGAVGLVQNVYMFGTPVVAKSDEYIKARSVVPGRFVNGYASNDWILGYLFRATSGGIMRVAGLNPVQVPTVENVNVTEYVPGHMAYRAAMPKLLREVGWQVESDEFTEIEDPDPENHEKRQRELISEIEEARKELEKKAAEKEAAGRKVSWWKRKKTDKKGWEVYDESSQKQQQEHKTIDPNGDPAKIAANDIMFDIDAIRREVASIAAEGKPYDAPEEDFEIKEIQSTLPPMKIDLPTTAMSPGPRPNGGLRETKSYNDNLDVTKNTSRSSSAITLNVNGTRTSTSARKQSFEEYDEWDQGPVEMTFDTSFHDSPRPSLQNDDVSAHERNRSPWDAQKSSTTPTLPPPSPLPQARSTRCDDPVPTPDHPSLHNTTQTPPRGPPGPGPAPRVSTNGTRTATGLGIDPSHNAWADEFEDDFGAEKDIKMSFM